jgi:menaquinone-dependent protoporphyrinogen oxidase
MPNVLVLYATNHGHTRKIAEVVAETLREEGVTAQLEDAANGPAEIAAFDGVIVGASVHGRVRAGVGVVLPRAPFL